MILETVKSEITAHLSYLFGMGKEAVAVDPQRDCRVYAEIAKREGVDIHYIFETHRNEDYVIGSKELSGITGAEIYHGTWPEFEYGLTTYDGQEFELERFTVEALHTPGHTPGCNSYVIYDKTSGDIPVIVFTGDALFVNEVGRADLGGDVKKPVWSANLYDSIHEKLLPLGDNVIVCPAHGAGSVCGSNIAEREVTTLGTERLMNPVLQMNREEFIEYKVKEHQEYPPYFRMMEKLNKEGSPPVGFGPNPKPLSPFEFEEDLEKEAIIVDTRSPTSFASGHIRGAYNAFTPLLGSIGWVLPYDKPILLVLDEETNLEKVSKGLVRIGYDYQVGYLSGTMVEWYREGYQLARLETMTVYELNKDLESGEEWHVLDVRGVDEYETGHIEGSQNLYVGRVDKEHEKVPADVPVAVICSSGVRSSFASSMLLRNGFENIHLTLGGLHAWKKAGFPTVE